MLEANLTNSERHLKRVATIVPARAARSAQISTLKGRTWIAKLKTDRVAIFRASASKTSNMAAVEEASAVTVLAVEDLAALVIALAEEASVAVVALAGSAVAAGADDKN